MEDLNKAKILPQLQFLLVVQVNHLKLELEKQVLIKQFLNFLHLDICKEFIQGNKMKIHLKTGNNQNPTIIKILAKVFFVDFFTDRFFVDHVKKPSNPNLKRLIITVIIL